MSGESEVVNHKEAEELAHLTKGSSNLARCYLDLLGRATPPGFETVPEGTMALLESLEWRLLASRSTMACAVCAHPVDAGHADDCKLSAILTTHRATQKIGEPT